MDRSETSPPRPPPSEFGERQSMGHSAREASLLQTQRAGSSLALELLSVHGPHLVASVGLELFADLPHVGEGGKPMHLTVIAPIHLMGADASLGLHILGSLGLLKINEDGEMNAREEIPIDERIISPLVIRPEHVILVLLGLEPLVALQAQNLVRHGLQLECVLIEDHPGLHGLIADKGSEPQVKGSPEIIDEQRVAGMEERQPDPDQEQRERDGVIPVRDVIDPGLRRAVGSAEGVPEGAADRHHVGPGERGAGADVRRGGGDPVPRGVVRRRGLGRRPEGVDGAGEGEEGG
mmetsp:Transcript_19418/g.41492  ORF Transcript_19418/g.41492 Transcript_19418/m.41492 type:complete len:293 (-) Transcript_19418:114-992(-)